MRPRRKLFDQTPTLNMAKMDITFILFNVKRLVQLRLPPPATYFESLALF